MRINNWMVDLNSKRLKIKKSGHKFNIYDATCLLCGRVYEKEMDSIRRLKNCRCKHALPEVSPRLQNIYNLMKQRCAGRIPSNLKAYYKKGIAVCQEWAVNPRIFYKWALENGYKENLTIDRIDNLKGYCPNNCRWASIIQQARNRTNNVVNLQIAMLIRNDLKTMKGVDVAKKYNISPSIVSNLKLNKIWKEV